MTQPPNIHYSLYTHVRYLSSHCPRGGAYISAAAASMFCISSRADGGERISTSVPKPNSQAIELRARDHVEHNREMLRPVGDYDHVLAEAIEHRADQMIGKT